MMKNLLIQARVKRKMKKSNKNEVIQKIMSIAEKEVYSKIKKKKAPELNMPLRALSNVKYDPKDGFFE